MEKAKLIPITDSVNSANWEVFTRWWAMTIAMSFGILPKRFDRVMPVEIRVDLERFDKALETVNLLIGIYDWHRPAIVLVLIILLLVIMGVK